MRGLESQHTIEISLCMLLVIRRALQASGQVTILQHAQNLGAYLGILAGPHEPELMLAGGCCRPL